MKEWYFTEQEYQAAQYALASELLENAHTTADCDNAAAIFTTLEGYKDAASKIELCSRKAVLLEQKRAMTKHYAYCVPVNIPFQIS